MKSKILSTALAAVVSSALFTSSVLADPGEFKVSTSYKTKDVEFRPGSTGVESDTDTDISSLALEYSATKRLSLTGTYTNSSSDTKRADGVKTNSDSDTYGLTAAYKLNRSLTLFGNYSFSSVDVSSNINANTFFDFDLDLDLFLVGATYAKLVDRTWLFTVTPTLAYADSDIADYIIRNANTPVEGSRNSVTTLSIAPSVSYIAGKAFYTATYTQKSKNRGADKASGKFKLGVNYRISKQVSLGASYAQDVSKDDIDGQEISIKLKVAI